MGDLRTSRVRWIVVLVGLVLTAAACWQVSRPQPLYWLRGEVRVLAPGAHVDDLPDYEFESGLITFAVMLEREYNGGEPIRLGSSEATLWGAGVRDGDSVLMLKGGNQWVNSFSMPRLLVEVVGADPVAVEERYVAIVGELQDDAARLQGEQGIAPAAQMTVQPVLDHVPVSYVGSDTGGLARAVLMTGLLGLSVTVAGAVIIDRRLGRRRMSVPVLVEPDPQRLVTASNGAVTD
ncbi:hypothetical protein [Xylanimonas ulmi]|nr:hypothetical protein [Xylanibacterium ulmi]